ncbi:hypothetical protein As57867_006980, partial [Aphanomyces stellatus]
MSLDDPDSELLDVELKRVAKSEYRAAEQTGRLSLTRLHLQRVPRSMQVVPRITELNLSHNCLARFPGAWIAHVFADLCVLHLECNQLHCLDDILGLSTLPHLRALHLQANPLPQLAHRIYFLEALIKAPTPRRPTVDPPLDLATPDETTTEPRVVNRRRARSATQTPAPVPRVHGGFRMLQELNGAIVSLEDIHAVERELGYVLRVKPASTNRGGHVEVGGTTKKLQARRAASKRVEALAGRKTVKEVMRKQFDSTTFPPPRHVPVLRYAVDGDMAPVALDDDDDDDPVDDNHADDDGLGIDGGSCDAQVEAVRRELRLGLVVSQASSSPVTMAVDEASPHDNNMEEHAAGTRHRAAAAASTWNETIQSFDALPNDQRCLVREKSKQCGPSLKDNPF